MIIVGVIDKERSRMIYINITTPNHRFREYQLNELHINLSLPKDNILKVKDIVSTIFQIASGQLPDTLSILYLKEIEDLSQRPTLTKHINTICKEILTNGRESVNITLSTKPIKQKEP